ncbi:MAG: 2-hydroxychromene-2-carboxylate isomerase, partial [Pseudomonadales bacterium]|nr:2-hydroxychromene-2-carboxylate isomerase [Pseudomonadales bacterium]
MKNKNKDPQFKEQGGVATIDPSPLLRWLSSKLLSHIASEKQLLKQRNKVERRRARAGAPHVVEYFHQLDDPYSHLAAQLLKPLLERYDIELKCYLVNGPTGGNAVEPELLASLARYDAEIIAPHYGLNFPTAKASPDAT